MSLRHHLLLPLLAGLLLWARPVAARQTTYAVCIGNNSAFASDGSAQLRFADDDAVRFFQLFSRVADHAWLFSVLDADTQRRYPDVVAKAEPPTLANLLRTVAELAQKMTADRARGDEPVLYLSYSGHGMAAASGPVGLAFIDGLLTQAGLYERVLAPLPVSYAHLLIDACNAGAVVGLRGPTAPQVGRPIELDVARTALSPGELGGLLENRSARFPTVGILAASSDGQEAHEWSRWQSGVFAHEVISGLLGAADANRDLLIEYSELQAFIAAANRSLPNPQAAPHLLVHVPDRNIHVPLLSLSALRDMAFLSGPAAQLGHFYIELENGQRYLDAHFAKDAYPTLAVPAGVRVFLRTPQAEAALWLGKGTQQAFSALSFVPRIAASRGSIDQAYERALFFEPYGPTYYRGFADRHAEAVGAIPDGPALDPRSEPRPRRAASLAASLIWGLSGAASVAAIISGVMALQVEQEFATTIYQRPAHGLAEQYRFASAVFWPSLSIVVAGAIGGGLLWLRRPPSRSTTDSN